MTSASQVDESPAALCVVDLIPYVSVAVLACTGNDPAVAFDALRGFLRRTAADQGRADSVTIAAELSVTGDETIDGVVLLGELGFEELYAVIRRVGRSPGWAGRDSGFMDVVHQLTIALRRNGLVAVYTDITTPAQFRRWIRRAVAPYRLIPPDVMAGTFPGDGKMVWTRGIHRPRTTKADSKVLGGTRVQDALDPIGDNSYMLTAAKVDYQPADDRSVLRDDLTVSAGKSRISWRRPSNFTQFLAATLEALDVLEKALVADTVPEALFPELAVRENDLGRVRGAFHVSVADPLEEEPDPDEDRIQRAELLRGAIIDVRGRPGSADALVDIGWDGSVTGTLKINLAETPGGFEFDIRIAGSPSDEQATRAIKDAMQDGDLLTVYYESGHTFVNNQIAKHNLASTPFPNLEFEDFTGIAITLEKPKPKPGQSVHDAIASSGDNSLFGWVVCRYIGGWLLCDDGSGEVADFLHLADNGTLTAIHVKAAGNHTPGRRIAVTMFEQVVSQVEKSIRQLDNDALIEHLTNRGLVAPAAWHDGHRIPAVDFIQQLHTRVRTDKTRIVIVQPHLLRSVHDRARAATQVGQPTRDSYSLMLLDTLLHSTRRTVTALWDDLTVIGCR